MTPEQTAIRIYEQFTHGHDEPTFVPRPGIVQRCLNLVAQFEDRAEIGFPELRMPMANGGTTLEYPGSDDFPF